VLNPKLRVLAAASCGVALLETQGMYGREALALCSVERWRERGTPPALVSLGHLAAVWEYEDGYTMVAGSERLDHTGQH